MGGASFLDSNATTGKDEAIVRIAGVSGNLADVTFIGGKNKLEANVTVVSNNTTFGQDPLPDTWFRIDNAGAIGDTVRIQLVATALDSSTPDRDAPAVDKTYTLVAGDVGDEIQLRDNLITALNGDANFSASLKAQKSSDRAIIHVVSKFFSMPTEFYERPVAGDFAVSVTGTTTVTLGFDTLISRNKASSLSQDPDSPHNLGVLGISGSVTVFPGGIGGRFLERFENASSVDMLVDGSSTPLVFTVPLDADDDIFITQVRIFGGGSSIKYGQFLAKNAILANGLEIKIQSDEETITLPLIKVTEDFKNLFSFPSGDDFKIDVQPSAGQFIAIFRPEIPFPLRKIGTFGTDDFITITVNDDLTSGNNQLEALATGFMN